MNSNLRVAHVVISLDPGGLERIVVDLVREGRRLGQQVAIICLERLGKLAERAETLGARLYCLDKGPGIRPMVFNRMRNVIREFRPHVIHAHTLGGLFYTGPLARTLGVPLVVQTEHTDTIRHTSGGRLSRLRKSILFKLSSQFCHRCFCVSKNIAEELAFHQLVSRDRLCVLLNGIDTEHIARPTDHKGLRQSLGIPSTALVIGTVGRLSPVKSQDLLIQAFARIRSQFPKAHLMLVGDGPSRSLLEELTARLGLRDSVHFAGYQAEPECYLQIMSVFALTSSLEGLPLAILEAWAVGLPVVASSVGGVPDLIVPGRNGLLFPSGDESALVEKLKELLEDPVRAACIGEESRREVVKHYSLNRMAGDYDRHYRELLRQKNLDRGIRGSMDSRETVSGAVACNL